MSDPVAPATPIWVFDTNVIVSAHLNAHGASARLWSQVTHGRLQIAYDARIAAEYVEVLARPRFGISAVVRRAFLDLLRLQHPIAPTPLPHPAPLPDEDDRCFLEVAQYATDKVLVTGNIKHYPETARAGALVLSPADAWLRFCR